MRYVIISLLFLSTLFIYTLSTSAEVDETLVMKARHAQSTVQDFYSFFWRISNTGSDENYFETLRSAGKIAPDATPTSIIPGYELIILPCEFPDENPLVLALPNSPDTENLVGFAEYRNDYSDPYIAGQSAGFLIPVELYSSKIDSDILEYISSAIAKIESGGELTRNDRRIILYRDVDYAIFFSLSGYELLYIGGKTYMVVSEQDSPFDIARKFFKEEVVKHQEKLARQSRAKGTLRSFGSSLLAYQGTNKDRLYGYFKDLQDDLYIAKEYTPENIIEGYTLLHLLSKDRKHFLIMAISDQELIPYAITEDQIVCQLYYMNPADFDTSQATLFTNGEDESSGNYIEAYFYKKFGKYYYMYDDRAWVGSPIL